MRGLTFDKVIVIANPISGWCAAKRWLGRVVRGFEEAGWSVEAVVTQCAGHARELAANHGYDNALVVAFGGDGTVNEVLNGLAFERSTLGIVPAGAGNVLAKELGLSWQPLEAVRQLLNGRVVRFDVGVCNGRRFGCVFGAGVDAWAVRMVHLRRRGGMTQWHYLPYVVRGVLSPASWEVEVEVDGRPFASGLDQVAVGNTHSYGGPMEMTSAAAPDDGLLDIMCVRRESILDLLGMAACGFLRTLHWHPLTHYARGTRVTVTSPKRDVPYELDGDDAGVLPAEILVQPGVARVLAPAGFRALQRGFPGDT